jgi:hypothetical protein
MMNVTSGTERDLVLPLQGKGGLGFLPGGVAPATLSQPSQAEALPIVVSLQFE